MMHYLNVRCEEVVEEGGLDLCSVVTPNNSTFRGMCPIFLWLVPDVFAACATYFCGMCPLFFLACSTTFVAYVPNCCGMCPIV